MNEFQGARACILPCSGPQEQTWVTKGSAAQSQSHIPEVEEHTVAAQGFPHLSLVSVCSSTGVLLSGGTEKDPAGFCL